VGERGRQLSPLRPCGRICAKCLHEPAFFNRRCPCTVRTAIFRVITQTNGKTGMGDSVLKSVERGGHHHSCVIDAAITHEFGGNHTTDVSHNGQLRDADAAKTLEASVRSNASRGLCHKGVFPSHIPSLFPYPPEVAPMRMLRFHSSSPTSAGSNVHNDLNGSAMPSADAFTWRRGESRRRRRPCVWEGGRSFRGDGSESKK